MNVHVRVKVSSKGGEMRGKRGREPSLVVKEKKKERREGEGGEGEREKENWIFV